MTGRTRKQRLRRGRGGEGGSRELYVFKIKMNKQTLTSRMPDLFRELVVQDVLACHGAHAEEDAVVPSIHIISFLLGSMLVLEFLRETYQPAVERPHPHLFVGSLPVDATYAIAYESCTVSHQPRCDRVLGRDAFAYPPLQAKLRGLQSRLHLFHSGLSGRI